MNYYARYYRSLWRGDIETARGMNVHCVRNVVFTVPIGTTFRRKRDNPAIGIVEGLQFIAGKFRKEDIEKIAPRARLDLFTDQSAYGPRVKSQWHSIINELNADPSSRRAVLVLPYTDEELSNRPCTTSMQFSVHKDKLNVLVNMRSSDAVWGLPYDLIQFSMVSMMLAKCLGLLPGMLKIFIGNAHIYESTHRYDFAWKEHHFNINNIIPNVLTPNSYKDAALEILNDPQMTAYSLCTLIRLEPAP